MRHQIRFEESGDRVAPIRERADRNGLADGRLWVAFVTMARRPTSRRQETVDGGRADGEQPLTNALLEPKVTVSFKCGQDHRQERRKTPAAKPSDASRSSCEATMSSG